MRELPRELSDDELAELFEGRTRFVERLAGAPDPLVRARTLVHELPADEKREILAAHPAIGQRTGLSARSAAEQGADADPAVLGGARAAQRRRTRSATDSVSSCSSTAGRRPRSSRCCRARIDNPTDDELETALGELVAIAEDRWRRG